MNFWVVFLSRGIAIGNFSFLTAPEKLNAALRGPNFAVDALEATSIYCIIITNVAPDMLYELIAVVSVIKFHLISLITNKSLQVRPGNLAEVRECALPPPSTNSSRDTNRK